jgi:outer membrane protein TolC
MRARIEQLGDGAVVPQRTYPPGADVGASTPRMTDKSPPSTNPGAKDLRYSVADEKRDVAARLADLQAADEDPAARAMDLADVLRQAQQTAREYLSAEEDYVLAAIRLLIERHRFELQPFADVSTTYSEAHTSGKRAMTQRLLAEVGARQRLPFGGEVSARWVWDASENLRSSATGRYVQASRLVLDGSVPLLRGAGDVAEEGLIQAERDLVYAARDFEEFRRQFLVSVSRDYFALLQQLDGIDSLRRQVQSLRDLEARQRSHYEAGRIPEFEVNIATSNVLNAQAGLANARELFILSLDRFKVRLGLPSREPVKIVAGELQVPEPETTPDRATDVALELRLDLQNRRDRLEDSKRQVLVAKNQLLPDLNLSGNVTLPTKAGEREGGAVYETDDASYGATALFSLPLDRRAEKLQVRATQIALERARRDYDRFRDGLILDVRAKVREIERARLNLRLADERVKINLRRKEEQSLKPDEVDVQRKVDTENELLDSERQRDRAKADLRNAVLDYLLATGQMRVRLDGTFEPLPGMEGAAGGAGGGGEPK